MVSGNVELTAKEFCREIWPMIFAASGTRIELYKEVRDEILEGENVLVVDVE